MAETEEFSPEQTAGWKDYTPEPEEREFSPEETDGWKAVTSSHLGSALRRGILEAPAGAAGAVTGVGGAIAGTAVGGPIGGIAGGLAGGAAGGAAASKLEEWILEQLGLREGTGFASRAQEYVDKAEHPYTSFAGEMAGNVAPGFGVGKGAMKLARGIGAGIQGGVEAGTEYARDEDLDPAKIAIAAGAGAVAAKPRGWVNKAVRPLDQHLNPEDYQRFQTQGDPYGPKPPQRPQRGLPPPSEANRPPQEGEVLGPETPPRLRRPAIEDSSQDFIEHDPYERSQKLLGDEHVDQDIQFANSQRDLYSPNDPLHKFWQDYIDQLDANRGKGRPEVVQEASQGVGDEFTVAHADRANDITTVARGIAHENPPAPEIETAGNPVGAPMEARTHAKPNDPLRDYRKDKPTSLPSPDSGNKMTQGQFTPDIVSALVSDKPRTTFEQQTVQPQGQAQLPTPQAPQRPQGPQLQALIDRGTQIAMRRPIVTTPIPEGANSSKNLSGPVYTDRSVPPQARRFVAVHETVEQMLMEQGHSYDDAHAIATQAEKAAVERAGGDWNKYDQKVDHGVERAAKEANAPQPADKHVSTQEALGEASPQVNAGASPQVSVYKGRRVLPVTEPVTTPEKAPLAHQDLIERARSGGLHEVADYLEKRPEVNAQQRAFLEQDMPKLAKKQAKAATDKKLKGETYKVEGLDVTHRGGQDGERKNAVNNSVRKGVDDALAMHWDPEEAGFNKDALIALAKNIKDYVIKENQGHDPFMRNGERAYTPQEWPAHYAVAKTAWDAVRHPDDPNVGTFWATVRANHESNMEAIRAIQEARKGAADTALNKRNVAFDEGAHYPEPGGFDRVSPETAKGVSTKVKTAADLPKASEGRSIDLNSPEGKALAEEAAARAPKKGNKAEQLSNIDDKIKAAIESDDPGTMLNKLADFLRNESGAAKTDKLFTNIKARMHSWFDPIQPDKPADAYAKSVGEDLVRLKNRRSQFKAKLRFMQKEVTKAFPHWDDKRWGRLYRAGEDDTVKTLPQEDQGIWNKYMEPMHKEYNQMYDEYRALATKNEMTGWDKLPPRVNLGAGFKSWMPRTPRGKAWENLDEYDAITPKEGQTLTPWAETTQPRQWFTAKATDGTRTAFYINEDGKAIMMRDGKARGAPIPLQDASQVGATFKMNHKGVEKTWTVDHATVDEINAASPGDGDKYHDHPLLSMAFALDGLHAAVERAKVYDRIVNSDMFKNNTTKNSQDSRIAAHGWTTTRLKNFQGMYMPKQLAWVLDQYRKPGLGMDTPTLDAVATSGTKLFYLLGPAVHALNEADKWFIGRGWSWLPGSGGYGRLVRTMSQAVKEVNTQGKVVQEMIENGANPMWAHTFTQRFMPKMAEGLGQEIKRNPSRWDPIFKAFGITAKEGFDKTYNLSTQGMWKFSDYLLTQRYLELKEMGHSPREAVKKTHDFIDSYVMPTHFKGLGQNDASHGLMQILTDPKFSLFAPYHYGVFHTWANMTKNLVGPNASRAERVEAAGHFMAAAMMLAVVYPAASSLYSTVTGDKNSELETRGASRLADTFKKVGTGEKGIDSALRNAWTPSVPLETAWQLGHNMNFAGQKIVVPGMGAGTNAAQVADYLAGQWASPIKAPITEALKGDRGHPVRSFIEGQTGLKTPTPEAEKYKLNQPKRVARDTKARQKKPGGLFEYFWNK